MQNQAAGPSLRRPLLLLVAALLVVPAILIGANAFGLRDYLGMGRLASILGSGGDGAGVQVKMSGTVKDADGKPAPGACVSMELVLEDRGESVATLSQIAHADETGRYSVGSFYESADLPRSEHLKVAVTLQAFGANGSTRPSVRFRVVVPPVAEATTDLQLCAPLATVPLRCIEESGNPVTHYWVTVIPVEGTFKAYEVPSLEAETEDGVAALPVWQKPFYVEVHLEHGARSTKVGPFDPNDLPKRIEVTLVDK